MKPLSIVSGILVLSAACLCPAQRLTSSGSGGFGMNSTYAKMYDRSSVITFRGKVTGITVGAPFAGTGNSVRLIVKATNGGSMLVEVGPQWYVDNQLVKLHLKDKVAITGSKIMLDNRGSIMARKIVKGHTAMVLRDTAGHPYWAANQPALLAYARDTFDTSGSAAQEIAAPQETPIVTAQVGAPTNQLAILPGVNATAPIYMAPAVLNGVIDHFTDVKGTIYMYMDVAGQSTAISLGPDWYIQNQDIVLNPGDLISATIFTPLSGSAGTAYAQSITDGGSTLYLINDMGMGNWQPWYPVAWPEPKPLPLPSGR